MVFTLNEYSAASNGPDHESVVNYSTYQLTVCSHHLCRHSYRGIKLNYTGLFWLLKIKGKTN